MTLHERSDINREVLGLPDYVVNGRLIWGRILALHYITLCTNTTDPCLTTLDGSYLRYERRATCSREATFTRPVFEFPLVLCTQKSSSIKQRRNTRTGCVEYESVVPNNLI